MTEIFDYPMKEGDEDNDIQALLHSPMVYQQGKSKDLKDLPRKFSTLFSLYPKYDISTKSVS